MKRTLSIALALAVFPLYLNAAPAKAPAFWAARSQNVWEFMGSNKYSLRESYGPFKGSQSASVKLQEGKKYAFAAVAGNDNGNFHLYLEEDGREIFRADYDWFNNVNIAFEWFNLPKTKSYILRLKDQTGGMTEYVMYVFEKK
ncbi:MAG: hypothetical protein EPN93_00230 [Spirochaetes bacterium]|nr:MAG: hypothetical protein EPN93_00230 [Spirochaetota bacterium]